MQNTAKYVQLQREGLRKRQTELALEQLLLLQKDVCVVRLVCTGTDTGLLLGAAQGQDTALKHQGWAMQGIHLAKPFHSLQEL